MRVSVVVPVYNGADTLADCLQALSSQSLAKDAYEVIVIDDGSSDGSAAIARSFGVRVITQANAGAPAARNTGAQAANARWVAFTDANAIVSRNWLKLLLKRVEESNGNIVAFGAAGPIRGHESKTPAARFVDMSGELDAERHLKHPRFPFAPSANMMYLREHLLDAGGFDERFASYDACDVHLRLREKTKLPFVFEPAALVLHRHRATWKQYWRQQRGYGVGYAQFLLRHQDRVRWGIADEARMLWSVLRHAARLALPARGDEAILRLGRFIRTAAHHLGFVQTFYHVAERRRWRPGVNQLSVVQMLRRAARTLLGPSDVFFAIAIAIFILRLPGTLARRDLRSLLRDFDKTRGGRARLEKVLRVRSAVLRILRGHDTCYARAFALYRFLAVAPERIDLRLATEPRFAQDRLQGLAWVMLDGKVLEGPELEAIARRRSVTVSAAAVS